MSSDEGAAEATARLAIEKAQVVLARCAPDDVVLAADTAVVVEDRILGKPSGSAQAAEMILSLSGRNHHVLTAWAVLVPAGLAVSGVCRSTVRMREISHAAAREYADTAEPLDKAGAYAAQGIGKRFIAAIEGPLDNVIGLPVAPVARALARAGIRPSS